MEVVVPIKANGYVIIDVPDHWDVEDKDESIRDLSTILIDRGIIQPKIDGYQTDQDTPITEIPF